MVLGMEEGLLCEILVDEVRLEHACKFKYLECVWDVLGTDGVVGGKLRVLSDSW